MAFPKRNYKDGSTVITAENMNAIQDAISDLDDRPVVTVEDIPGGHRIIVTDHNGIRNYDIMEGGGGEGGSGADGISCTHSWNGTVLTVSSASGTSSADLQGPRGPEGQPGPQGEPGRDGSNGYDGSDGYTPVRGVDYFTPEDVANIVQQVVAQMPHFYLQPMKPTDWKDGDWWAEIIVEG